LQVMAAVAAVVAIMAVAAVVEAGATLEGAGVAAGVTMVVAAGVEGVVGLCLAVRWPSACSRPWGSSLLPLQACLSSRVR
jgi:hypothetical protein